MVNIFRKVSTISVHLFIRSCAYKKYGQTNGQGDSYILESPVSTPLSNFCTHRITFSSRKVIILDKLSCFQSKHTFWEVREHIFCLKYRCQRVYVCYHYYFDRHQFRRLSLVVEENNFTVAQGVLCIVQ